MVLMPAHIKEANLYQVYKCSFCTAESHEADRAVIPSTHLHQAEADPLFGQVGVIRNIWLRLHHRFILIEGFLVTDCT